MVTARVVGEIARLVPWTAPFARDGGHLVFIKGQRAEQELRECQHTLARFLCTHERTVPTSTGRVVVLRVGT